MCTPVIISPTRSRLAQGVERNTAQVSAACIPLYFSHMVAERGCSWIFAERAEDLQKVGKQPVDWVEGQNAVVSQMVDQWLEVPKMLPQDRVLQTAKQIADHLDKRALAGTEKTQLEGLWNDRHRRLKSVRR